MTKVCFNFSTQTKDLTRKIFWHTFFLMIDERRRYTKKVNPLKAWVGPSIVKRGRRGDFMGWVGVEGICGCGS